jgi:hypothetical protein
MIINKAMSTDAVAANVQKGKNVAEGIRGGGVFKVECFDSEGNHKWTTQSPNLVVNVGLKDMNDKYFTGSATQRLGSLDYMVLRQLTTLLLAIPPPLTLVGLR